MRSEVYNEDCMEVIGRYPTGYFDLAVVDPPYFSGPERRGYYGSKISKIGVHRDYPVSPAWEVPGRAYFDELRRVAKHYIVWGCNYFKRIHPTQKPVALYDWLFQRYASPGMRVLDTHLGSGSSRIAAYKAGLDFVGVEIDPTYYKAAEDRFADYTAQTSLWEP